MWLYNPLIWWGALIIVSLLVNHFIQKQSSETIKQWLDALAENNFTGNTKQTPHLQVTGEPIQHVQMKERA
jgi:hypothetical protein